MSTSIIHALNNYCLAKRSNDKNEQLRIADELVEHLIPELLEQKNETAIQAEEDTLG